MAKLPIDRRYELRLNPYKSIRDTEKAWGLRPMSWRAHVVHQELAIRAAPGCYVDIGQRALADACGLPQQRMTKALRELEQRGLILREIMPNGRHRYKRPELNMYFAPTSVSTETCASS